MTGVPIRSGPASLSGPGLRVEARLERLLSAEAVRWTAVDPALAAPWATLGAAVLAGGKRLRPAFCYWSFVGVGGDPESSAVIDAGAALEMLHAAALVHDDVIDRSARRHGAPTAHVEHADRHRGARSRGDSDRFGQGVAILLGDLALAYSSRLLAGAPVAAREVFDEVQLEVNVGQYLDLLGGAEGLGGAAGDFETRAERICRYKTAKYTVERPLHLGVALAAPERLPDLLGPLSAFGLPLGEAFQLRDDLLGVFGDPDVTGKPVGDDLRDGKLTLLAALARAAATGASARLFDQRFGAADLSDAEARDLAGVIESTGARARVESAIERLAGAAEGAVAALPLTAEARRALGELAAFVTGRDY
jgi:geranylgeranyl diphosphate synthase type I